MLQRVRDDGHIMTNPTEFSLAQLRDALKKKDVTSLEATDAYLSRIENAGALNTFVTVTADKARDMAKASDAKLAKGEGAPLSRRRSGAP